MKKQILTYAVIWTLLFSLCSCTAYGGGKDDGVIRAGKLAGTVMQDADAMGRA